MVCKIADNIFSPLGFTTEENYQHVRQGCSGVRRHEGWRGLPYPFAASLFDWNRVQLVDGFTPFESIVIRSVEGALAQTDVDAASPSVLFVLSTTKGNVDLLEAPSPASAMQRLPLGAAAQVVASYFGNPNMPVVVSNACISGLNAQIVAMRALQCGSYDTVVVVGADVLSRFIVSGFGSFKALAAEPCRPFDIERFGLNLGEAAATIIYRRAEAGSWHAVRGAIRNDAHHVANPSPKGEGCYRALRYVMQGQSAGDIAFVGTHGTSTLYNDEMESAAIDRAGLLAVPANSLKGYYGHTMGAAGVLETVLSMRALDDGIVLGTKGFATMGVSHPLNVSASHRTTDKRAFVKLLSGFGGCNAAMLFKKGGVA